MRLSDRFAPLLKFVRSTRAELLTAAALLAGWLLITAGIASLTSPRAWTFSIGALCISLGGWRMLWQIATSGLYALTRRKRR